MRTIKQVNIFDAHDGSLISTSSGYQRSVFGIGWIVLNKKATKSLIHRCGAMAATVFFFLAAKQDYTEVVKITVGAVAEQMEIGKATASRAFKELEEANLIRRIVVDGTPAVLLNPNVTACGRAAVKGRNALWNLEEGICAISLDKPHVPDVELEEVEAND